MVNAVAYVAKVLVGHTKRGRGAAIADFLFAKLTFK